MERIIWNSNINDWDEKEFIEEYKEVHGEVPSENELYRYMHDLSMVYLEDVEGEIKYHENAFGKKQYIVSATLGLWNGNFKGGKIITGLWNVITQCFEDYNKIYEERGRLKINATHHDGTNYFQIKELTEKGVEFAERHKWDLSDRALHEKLFNDSHYSKNVQMFKKIYGW